MLQNNEDLYQRSLRTHGQATLTINSYPRNASHLRSHQLGESNDDTPFEWVTDWSDGDEPSTLDEEDDLVLPTFRTWFSHRITPCIQMYCSHNQARFGSLVL